MMHHFVKKLIPGLIFIVLPVTGCNTVRGKRLPDPNVQVAPPPPVQEVVVQEPSIIGRIAIVGAESAFVVFQNEPGQKAVAGETLDVRFAGSKIGTVTVNPPNPQFPKFSVADVVSGNVEKGYELVRPVP